MKVAHGHDTWQHLIHLLGRWRCQSRLWTNSVVWQRKVESNLESCNRTIEAFVRSGLCCISITVHLLITPSNPKDWLSILGYSPHDLHVKVVVGGCGTRLIPVVKPMWGLISLHDLTSRAIGFKSISDDYIMFQAPLHLVRPKLTSACSGKNFDDHDQKAWPQNCSHYSFQVETWHSLSESFVRFAASRQLAVDSQQTFGLQKEQPKQYCFVYRQAWALSLSLPAVVANKGSKRSTVLSLWATVLLIIVETWNK